MQYLTPTLEGNKWLHILAAFILGRALLVLVRQDDFWVYGTKENIPSSSARNINPAISPLAATLLIALSGFLLQNIHDIEYI